MSLRKVEENKQGSCPHVLFYGADGKDISQGVERTCIGTVLAHLSDCFVAFSLPKGSSLLKLSGYSFGF